MASIPPEVGDGAEAPPLKDVAAAGGWKCTETLLRCYQQPDERTMLDVVLGGGELWDRKA